MELGTEIAAVLGFSAIKNNDKVGVLLFSDEVEKYIPPKKRKSHILRVIRELLYYKPKFRGTSINSALDFLLKVAKRRSVIFLISDFVDSNYWTSLKMVNKKHDIIGIRLYDPSEAELPDLGLVKVMDPESWCKKIKFDLIPISTQEDYVEPLMDFFHRREKRV